MTRSDVIQALILGSEGTPYANGAFLYDILLTTQYPRQPPMTTGGQTVRFNPNLYSNGKVCLSILGTWSGSIQEKWNSETSNLNQVLMSIQSLVMSEDIYFNEPSYQKFKGTEKGDLGNIGYSNIVRYANLKYAINEMLEKNPYPLFEDILQVHFYLKKTQICAMVEEWIKDAQIQEEQKQYLNIYQGMVRHQNHKIASEFAKTGSYLRSLEIEYEKLKKNLSKLDHNKIQKIVYKWKK